MSWKVFFLIIVKEYKQPICLPMEKQLNKYQYPIQKNIIHSIIYYIKQNQVVKGEIRIWGNAYICCQRGKQKIKSPIQCNTTFVNYMYKTHRTYTKMLYLDDSIFFKSSIINNTTIIVFKKLIFNTMFPQNKLYLVRYFCKSAFDILRN